MEPRQPVKINNATKEFNTKVQALINEGIDPDDIIDKLKWDKTPFSLVRSARRNVPAEKMELFLSVFKNEIEAAMNGGEKKREEPLPQGDHLTKYVALLEKTVETMEGRIQSLLQLNATLKEKVHSNLQTVLTNQLVQASLSESLLQELTKLMAPVGELSAKELNVTLHKSASVRLSALMRTGTALQIDNEDIMTLNAVVS